MPEKKFRITRTATEGGEYMYELHRFGSSDWVFVRKTPNRKYLEDMIDNIVEAEKMEPIYYDEDGKEIHE